MSNQLKYCRTIDEEANYIAIVGRISPPFGGVSVYLSRLLRKLLEVGVRFYLYDLSGKSDPAMGVYPGRNSAMWLLRFCLSSSHKLVHFHLSNSLAVVMGGMLLLVRGRRLAITLHGEGVMHTACGGRFWIRLLLRWVLKKADRLFAVNPAVADWLLAIGIDEKRIIRMTPFLKPTPQETNINRLNKQLRRFLEKSSASPSRKNAPELFLIKRPPPAKYIQLGSQLSMAHGIVFFRYGSSVDKTTGKRLSENRFVYRCEWYI